MPGLRCKFCGKDWVQPCWDANEAASCGNLDRQAMTEARELVKAMDNVDALRGARTRASRARKTKR